MFLNMSGTAYRWELKCLFFWLGIYDDSRSTDCFRGVPLPALFLRVIVIFPVVLIMAVFVLMKEFCWNMFGVDILLLTSKPV